MNRQTTPTPGTSMPQPGSEYLTFKLGKEEYGIDILQVQEIRSWEEPTQLVSTPAFVKGVMNLRDVIVPIIDLRIRFGLPADAYDTSTVVIVLNTASRVVGLVVDGVSDVTRLGADRMRPVPGAAAAADADCLLAIGQIGERTLILLDTEKLIPSLGFGGSDMVQ